jgi:hypothetical protein
MIAGTLWEVKSVFVLNPDLGMELNIGAAGPWGTTPLLVLTIVEPWERFSKLLTFFADRPVNGRHRARPGEPIK